jgi:hypothetical protein
VVETLAASLAASPQRHGLADKTSDARAPAPTRGRRTAEPSRAIACRVCSGGRGSGGAGATMAAGGLAQAAASQQLASTVVPCHPQAQGGTCSGGFAPRTAALGARSSQFVRPHAGLSAGATSSGVCRRFNSSSSRPLLNCAPSLLVSGVLLQGTFPPCLDFRGVSIGWWFLDCSWTSDEKFPSSLS